MTRHESETSKPRILFTALAAAVMSVALSGCLDGSDNDDDRVVDSNNPLIIDTAQGEVQGIELDGMRVFRGVRYGEEPERFAAPVMASERSEPQVLNEEFATSCPQPAGSTFAIPSDNEDCLFLNVYAPEQADEKHPVMVWIHGGSFVTGSGGDAYEPKRLVEQGVVVVTINYRLGALGFLPHSSLADENQSYGNYGLMDQRLALEWVEQNIEAFSGDPDNVTIFGESAGGHSVASHLASPQSAGLFDKAIIHSGSYSPDQIPQEAGETLFGDDFAAATGCDTSDDVGQCLRELPIETILENQMANYLPVTGGSVLPQSIDAVLSSGNFNGEAIMIGSNQHEGRLFVGIQEFSSRVTSENYAANVSALLGTDLRPYDRGQVAADYLDRVVEAEGLAADDPTRYARALAAINTDWRFACGTTSQLEQVDSADVDAYGYWFTDENAPNIVRTAQGPLTPPSFPWGASHAYEIQYVLADQATLESRGATEAQLDLANTMARYWTNFAKYGDPTSTEGASNDVEWNAIGQSGTIIELDPAELSEVPATTFDSYHNCDFWEDPVAAQASNI